ncbi:hypothetical protein [Nitrospirillum sp. BR 11828]|uniref:hypothetical protein n=1 Tax=Nitrospirillum sp. BR 11828 TaxID=3104325 RepID=UPI002ACA3489|nr:hypothetical protein [Nitrospirillum sp. BR 11828]MDZ5649489.1 hypothetical protein [Nitrospirillum sp. BR 11828]
MPSTTPALRVLLALAGTCCTGPGGGALVLAQVDWLAPRLRAWAVRKWGAERRGLLGKMLIKTVKFSQPPTFPSIPAG